MTIDDKDYEPRPADDFCSQLPSPHDVTPQIHKLISLIDGEQRRADPSAKCHQLGCNFSELPHG